ncbi:unnamed protein product [Tuber melanosporum]|uniref:(Perigord truffle) hypothetical protein n=1 Tax=Tuber melanosporum (strain Mel28) TaxID=656061 RepID=D5GHB5_TUBMM|nr:uncharacterized protein GSTUM_00007734001 [Tuber melanosporum]CAZ83867.1 unnamed protein product [Tuber melanosporum]
MPRSYSEDIIDSDSDADSPNPLAAALVTRAHRLLDSLESLQTHLRRHSLTKEVEIRPFATSLRSETRMLEALAATPPTPESTHSMRSSNLSYLEAVWKCARAQVGVRGICQSFGFVDKEGKAGDWGGGHSKERKGKKGSVCVDVVAGNGLVWIKVSTITAERVVHSLAKGGWEDAEGEVGLVKCVRGLVKASGCFRVQYLHPSVLVWLPSLLLDGGGEGAQGEERVAVEGFIKAIMAEGARVQLGSGAILGGEEDPIAAAIETSAEKALQEMIKPLITTSTTINLDVTILLALVSDITHGPVAIQERFHPAIHRQLALESSGRRMGEEIYPLLHARTLLTTVTAKKRFVEIVDIVGSSSEKERTRMVLEGQAEEGEWEGLSTYGLDHNSAGASGGKWELKLPVGVIEDDWAPENQPQQRIVAKLSTVNRAVFVTGWKKGFTTITSNRTVAKTIEGLIEDGETGPDMFVLNTSRSLVGKAKRIDV